ncbi:MAG: hypothetical protein JSV96_17800 [Candidatus Aminicenantes bacterium]|nr:MAG: hypothetical protein JSV96_17800 [Candidatus Aminicenantes bacterium]
MLRCRIIGFFFNVFPLKVWQSFLIRRHLQKCPECQRELASIAEVRSLLTQESEGESLEGEWLAIRGKLSGGKRKERDLFSPRLRWAAGVASLFVVAVAVIGSWLYFSYTPGKSPQEKDLGERFRINYIRVDDKPAKTFLFRPHDSKMIIIWAEKNS